MAILVTFMDGHSFYDVTNHKHAEESNMAAVFVGLRLSAVDTECEVWWLLLVGRTLLTLHRTFYLEDLLPGCLGDQGSCELVLRRIS